MIVTTDIGNILYRDCKAFGMGMVSSWDELKDEVTSEKAVIITKRQQPGKYWKKGFVEVNLCVPDLDGLGTANTIRMGELKNRKTFCDAFSNHFVSVLKLLTQNEL